MTTVRTFDTNNVDLALCLTDACAEFAYNHLPGEVLQLLQVMGSGDIMEEFADYLSKWLATGLTSKYDLLQEYEHHSGSIGLIKYRSFLHDIRNAEVQKVFRNGMAQVRSEREEARSQYEEGRTLQAPSEGNRKLLAPEQPSTPKRGRLF